MRTISLNQNKISILCCFFMIGLICFAWSAQSIEVKVQEGKVEAESRIDSRELYVAQNEGPVDTRPQSIESTGSFVLSDFTNYNIDDLSSKCISMINPSGAPAGSYVTKVEFYFRIDDRGDPATFYCVDYEVYLNSDTHGYCTEFLNVYNNLGGATDGNFDDDAENDSDVYVDYLVNNNRYTNAFNGENPNQWWDIKIKDTITGVPPGYGLIDAVELRISWANDGPVMTSITSPTHPVGVWKNVSTATFNWTATDANGIAGYSYIVDHAAGTVPDMVVDGASNTVNINIPDAANWYFHIRGKDNLDNWGAAMHYGPFHIDTGRHQYLLYHRLHTRRIYAVIIMTRHSTGQYLQT